MQGNQELLSKVRAISTSIVGGSGAQSLLARAPTMLDEGIGRAVATTTEFSSVNASEGAVGALRKAKASDANSQLISRGTDLLSKVAKTAQVQRVLGEATKHAGDMDKHAGDGLNKVESLIASVRDSKKGQDLLQEASKLVTKGAGLAAGKGGGTTVNSQVLKKAMANVSAKDAGDLLDEASRAIEGGTKEVRVAFLEHLKDSALDFLFKCLPAVQVPPITGVKDQIAYVEKILRVKPSS